MGWSCYVRQGGMGGGMVKIIKIRAYLSKALLKGFDQTWMLGMSFARGTMWETLGIGIDNVGMELGT